MGYFDHITAPAWNDTAAVMADVAPYESLPAPTRRRNADTNDQVDLKDWYRTCGPVRVAVNTPASTVSKQNLIVEYDNGRTWETATDAKFAAIMRAFKGRTRDQEALIRSIAVATRVPAEGYLVLATEGNDVHYTLVQSCSLRTVQGRPGFSEYFTRRGARPGELGHQMVPDKFVYWFHHPDPDFPDDPWSPLLVGADSILRFKKAYRHVGRTLDQKLAMGNVLWAKATSNGSNWQKEIWDWAFNSSESDDGIESISPLLMSTEEKPEAIELGTKVYADQLAIAQDALQQFARDVDFPTGWMVDGPGQAKYDNETATFEWYLDNSVAPMAAEVADIITRVHLRPFIASTELGRGLDPQRFRVRFDDRSMRPTGDREHDFVELYKLGLITRQALAELCGIDAAHIMRLPDGIVDYEHWLASQSPGAIATSEFGVAGIHRPDPADILDAEVVPQELTAVSAELAPSWDQLV